MPLLSVVALQGDSLALALVMAANRQHQRVDDIAIGAEQGHLPAREAFEQPGRSARRSRRTWTRSTQKPVSALWKVTRSTMPTSISPAPCRTTPSMAVVKVSKLRLQQIRGVLHVSDHCRHASDGPGSALKAPSISSFSNRGAVPAGKINVLLVC